jgi:hypothetical protein
MECDTAPSALMKQTSSSIGSPSGSVTASSRASRLFRRVIMFGNGSATRRRSGGGPCSSPRTQWILHETRASVPGMASPSISRQHGRTAREHLGQRLSLLVVRRFVSLFEAGAGQFCLSDWIWACTRCASRYRADSRQGSRLLQLRRQV